MITQQQIENEIRQTLDLGEQELLPSALLQDLPTWDSVNALRVLVDLETGLGLRLDIQKFMNAETVADLLGACLGAAKS